jgi:hypothetical protein
MVLTKRGQKANTKNQKKFQKQNIKLLCSSHSLVAVEKLSVSPKLSSVVFKSFCDLQSVFLPLILWKYDSPKSKVKVNALNESKQ